jgi:hypothetical protein
VLQSKEKDIDGHKFVVTQLPATRALKLLHRLANAVGPALGFAITSSGGIEKLEKAEVHLGQAVQTLFDRFTESEMERTVKDLLYAATMDGAPIASIDNIFAGRLGLLMQVCRFALEVNFEDFFAVLAPFAARAQEAMSRKTDPKSSGQSGALSSVA